MALTNSSSIMASSAASGDAGNMKIDASQLVHIGSFSRLESTADGTGHAGQITILTPTLTVNDGGHISTSTTASGHAGDVTIQGTRSSAQSVLIDGPGSGIFTDTQGTEAGGNIVVNANTVTLQNGGTLSAKTSGAEATAVGGSITVTATNHVTMTGEALITASSTGPANAGAISINAGQQLDLTGKSSITTEAKTASGGDIDIRAIDRVRLVNSSINTSVFGGDGNGGNITIDPNVVVLQGSQVRAESFKGIGGDITITTRLFLADSTSQVSALSPFGLNGTVTIQSPTSNLSGSLGPLASQPSQAHTLLTQRCAALVNGRASSFVVAGREQLPADPGGWLSSPLALTALGESFDAGPAVASAPALMSIAAHDTSTISLRRLTPARFLMANFAESEATGCHS